MTIFGVKNSSRNLPSTGRYEMFDLMRGLAALAVLLYHMSYMLGSYAPDMTKGYLAVDFFFILSGFVIAANYHVTVRPTISWFDFLAARFARLWPLFIFATLLGSIVVTAKLTRDTGYFDASSVIMSLSLNSMMLPSFLQSYGVDRLFLFNGASWSVFFEMLINIIFFAILRNLSLRSLIVITVFFAGLMLFVAQLNDGLDGGWAATNFHVGVARVLFGFSAGIVIYLIREEISLQVNAWFALCLVVCLCASFFIKGGWLVDCIVAMVVFPLLILLASGCHLKGIFKFVGCRLGDISYSVYLLQTPAMLFTAGVSQAIFGHKIAIFAPVSGILFIVALLMVSYLSWRYFEIPARDCVRQRLRSFQVKLTKDEAIK